MAWGKTGRIMACAILALGAASIGAAHQALAQARKIETPKLTIGLSVNDSTFLPIYLAEVAEFYKQEGLNVSVLAFRGGSDLTRALVARSVHIGVAAPTSVLAAISAGEDVRVFYGGFVQTPFFWFAAPPIKSMQEAKGKRMGITRFGSSTDALTRFALARAGLDAKDVRIVQGGGSAERLAAMDSKQIDIGIFTWPHNFAAEDRGYNLIQKQSDLMKDFPIQSFYAMKPFLDSNPETVRAVLRAFVKAVRLARADKALSVKTLVARAGLEEQYAGRAYDQLIEGWREDGLLASEEGMKSFFDMAIAAGDVTEHWPREKYWDGRFTASFEQWKPN
ncbi:MAG: ABC transporter substrate-binding protein [Beijerinckiaceae bacterium]